MFFSIKAPIFFSFLHHHPPFCWWPPPGITCPRGWMMEFKATAILVDGRERERERGAAGKARGSARRGDETKARKWSVLDTQKVADVIERVVFDEPSALDPPRKTNSGLPSSPGRQWGPRPRPRRRPFIGRRGEREEEKETRTKATTKNKTKTKKKTNNKHGRMGQGSLAFQVRVSVLVKLVLALKKYVWPIQPITNLTKFDLVQFHCQCETSGAIFLELFRCFFIPSLCADMLVFNQSLTNLTKFDLVQFHCQCETSGAIFLELFRCFFIPSLCADMLIFNQSFSPIIIWVTAANERGLCFWCRRSQKKTKTKQKQNKTKMTKKNGERRRWQFQGKNLGARRPSLLPRGKKKRQRKKEDQEMAVFVCSAAVHFVSLA